MLLTMFSSHSEDVLASTTPRLPAEVDRPWSPKAEVAPNCPRCDSANTKFCYYNNYSLSQPRYLCKACRRYWTKGGSLRNVPVGGGCRRKRGGKSTTSTRAAADSRGAEFSKSRTDLPRGQHSTRPDVMRSDVAIGSSSATDGTCAIDLEELYAKYTNRGGTDSEDFAVMPPLPDAELDKDEAGFIRTSSESSSCDLQMNYNVVPLQLPTHRQIEEFSDEYYYSIALKDSTNLFVDWLTMPTSTEPAAGNYRHDQMIFDFPCGSPYDQEFDSVNGICHQKNLTTEIEYCSSCSLDYNYSVWMLSMDHAKP